MYYTILFEVTGLGLTAPISVTGEIDKLVGEDLEEAFERNYEDGNLASPTGGPPQNFTSGNSGGGLDIGTLGTNGYWTANGNAGISYQPTAQKGVVTITDLN